MSALDLNALPETLGIGNVITMTFLRNQPYLTKIRVPANPSGETLNADPHWHEKHDELFRVIKGRLRVTIGGETRDYDASDGEVLVPRGVVHSLKGFSEEETIFEERTGPMDSEKELLFRNIFAEGEMPTSMLQLTVAAYHGDTCPALPLRMRWLEKAIVVIIGGYIAPMLGYRNKYDNSRLKTT